jgi:hypothetical protein
LSSERVFRLDYRITDEHSPYDELGQERYEPTAEDYEAVRSMIGAPAQDPEFEQIFQAINESMDENLTNIAEVEAEFSDFDDEIDEAFERNLPFQEIKRDYGAGLTRRVTVEWVSGEVFRTLSFYRDQAGW